MVRIILLTAALALVACGDDQPATDGNGDNGPSHEYPITTPEDYPSECNGSEGVTLNTQTVDLDSQQLDETIALGVETFAPCYEGSALCEESESPAGVYRETAAVRIFFEGGDAGAWVGAEVALYRDGELVEETSEPGGPNSSMFYLGGAAEPWTAGEYTLEISGETNHQSIEIEASKWDDFIEAECLEG